MTLFGINTRTNNITVKGLLGQLCLNPSPRSLEAASRPPRKINSHKDDNRDWFQVFRHILGAALLFILINQCAKIVDRFHPRHLKLYNTSDFYKNEVLSNL